MLESADFRKPTQVCAHGFVTVDDQKMSKSRGTFINAKTYLEHLDPEYLRYYFAAKMSNDVDDLDLNLEDFVQRVNSDVIGKVVNIPSRCANFITKHFDATLAASCTGEELELYHSCVERGKTIAEFYENREFGKAMREVMAYADIANEYIHINEPWAQIKDDSKKQRVLDVCSLGVNLFRVLMTYLYPVLPKMGQGRRGISQHRAQME